MKQRRKLQLTAMNGLSALKLTELHVLHALLVRYHSKSSIKSTFKSLKLLFILLS